MTRPCASRTLPLELSPWAMPAHAVGTLDARAEPTWPRQAFSSIAAMYLCWPALLRRPLAVRSRLGPNVDGVAAGFKEVSYYHRVTPAGLSNRARRTPVRGGVASATVANVGGRCIQATRDAGFRRAACAHTGAVHGPVDPVLPRVAPALAWTLNKYTPAKGV